LPKVKITVVDGSHRFWKTPSRKKSLVGPMFRPEE
jgi:hypothetical protein